MGESNIDETMKAHANEAIATAARYDVVLDYSERSLDAVDELLSRESFMGATPRAPESHDDGEALWTCSTVMGAYVGEVVLRVLGGHWVAEATEHGGAAIELDGATSFPIDMIWRRLTKTEHEAVRGYCRALRATGYGQSQLE